MKQMLLPFSSTVSDGVIDDRHNDGGQEEISPIFLDPWTHFTSDPAKAMDSIGTPQYMDYPGLGNVSY